MALTEEAARLAIALDHGYADWGAARADADLGVSTRFEAAADAIQWGEQSPPNAARVMQLLLDRGADPDAACDLYGGGPGMTTLCLDPT